MAGMIGQIHSGGGKTVGGSGGCGGRWKRGGSGTDSLVGRYVFRADDLTPRGRPDLFAAGSINFCRYFAKNSAFLYEE